MRELYDGSRESRWVLGCLVLVREGLVQVGLGLGSVGVGLVGAEG